MEQVSIETALEFARIKVELSKYSDDEFRAEFERRFPSLFYDFIVTMQEIGDLGLAKYKENCIEQRVKNGNRSRDMHRIVRSEILRHSRVHGSEYEDGIEHDVYKTGRHQLGASAFNVMMEFALSDLMRKEPINKDQILKEYLGNK